MTTTPPPGADEQLLSRLKALECPDATFPAHDPSLVLTRAAGSLVYDAAGREYVDLCAGFGALALGHNPDAHRPLHAARAGGGVPPITHGMGDVYPSRAKVELIELLLSLMPPHLVRAALALTGAQAVELAVKTALLATGRSGFVTFDGSYHGLDLGVLPLTSKAAFRAPFQGFVVEGKVESVPFLAGEAELDQAIGRLAGRGHGCAAVFVEPVQGRVGIRPAPLPWLATLRRVCDRYGALLVFDEVWTGLGRSGRLTYADSVPADLVCFGKALGGGFPVSALVGTAAAVGAWPASTGEALHTGTFFGHPLGCEAALATLRTIAGARLWEQAAETGDWARERLADLVGAHPAVKEIRGLGLMVALELRRDGDGARLMDLLRRRGVIALASGERGESLTLSPALTIGKDLLERAFGRLAVSLDELS